MVLDRQSGGACIYQKYHKRFKVFEANQVQKIQEHSDVNQWNYVKGKDNPADDGLRGLDSRKETSSNRWFTGPAFLWQREDLCSSYSEVTCAGDDDPEIKKEVKVSAVQLGNDVLENIERRFSNWCKLKRIVALPYFCAISLQIFIIFLDNTKLKIE